MVAQGGRDITPVMQQPGAAEPITPQTSQEARSMNRSAAWGGQCLDGIPQDGEAG